jgi:hypothetical protein
MFGKAFRATFGVGCALVVGVIALIVIAGALGSRGAPSTGPTTAPLGTNQAAASTAAAGAKSFVAVKEWSGSGIKNTEDFTVAGDQWKIKWSNTAGGIIQIFVYKSSDKSLVGLAANTQAAGDGESIQRGAGTYYLTINSANTNWKVTVEDLR